MRRGEPGFESVPRLARRFLIMNDDARYFCRAEKPSCELRDEVDELLTRREAAKMLKIGLRTLDRRLASGELECIRLGVGPKAPVRIARRQIVAFLQRVSVTRDNTEHLHALRILKR